MSKNKSGVSGTPSGIGGHSQVPAKENLTGGGQHIKQPGGKK